MTKDNDASSSCNTTTSSRRITQIADARVQRLDDIIGTDAGERGMKALIVPGDLIHASRVFASVPVPIERDMNGDNQNQGTPTTPENGMDHENHDSSLVLILTGFPCCVRESPPTETDGPPGAVALARAAIHLGHSVMICTDECNGVVLQAAIDGVDEFWSSAERGKLHLKLFPSTITKSQDEEMRTLAQRCCLLLACERAGPAADGMCYTMRGINMNSHNLIAPLHNLVEYSNCPFLAIGDGGNELGMGKVIDQVKSHIPSGERVGCVIAADHLIAASVSNWGAYALAAGAAIMRARQESSSEDDFRRNVVNWIAKCLPTVDEEVDLLKRCVSKGCRDGVSGELDATVDGMPLDTSMQCLRDLRTAALSL